MSPMRLNMLFVGIVTVLTGGFTAGVLLPGLRELENSRNEVTAAADRTREAQVTAGDESAIYQAILNLERELEESRRHVPAERQFGEFLNNVSEALRSLNVNSYELRPLSERPLSAADGVTTSVGTGPAFVLPVRLKIECSFKSTFEFLTRLADMPRLTRIAAIEINGKDSRSARVEVRMLIETYYCPEIVDAADSAAPEVRP